MSRNDLKPTIHGGTNYQIAKNRDIHKDYIRSMVSQMQMEFLKMFSSLGLAKDKV